MLRKSRRFSAPQKQLLESLESRFLLTALPLQQPPEGITPVGTGPAVPVINWTSPIAILYGTPLSSVQLNATASSGPGTFTYTTPVGTVLPPGEQLLHVDYTPDDTTHWTTASKSVWIYVPLDAPTIDISMPDTFEYGSAVVATTVDTASAYPLTGKVQFTVDGNNLGTPMNFSSAFAFLPTLDVGTHTVAISYLGDPSNAPASATHVLTVIKARTFLNWNGITFDPQASEYGTPLPTTNPSPNTPGTFTYAYPAGSILPVGQYTQTVTFTPDNPNYQTVTQTLRLWVLATDPHLDLTSSLANPTAADGLTFTAHAYLPLTQPTGLIQFLIDGHVIGDNVTLVDGIATCTVSSLSAGNHTITAEYSGDGNFYARTTSMTQSVQAYIPPPPPPPPTLIPPVGKLDAFTGFQLTGWALDGDFDSTPLTMRIDIDGTTTGTTTANLPRLDLIDPYFHGFSYTLPALPLGLHRVDVYALDPANDDPVLISSRQINTNRPPTGGLDVVTSTTFIGWAYDANAGDAPIQVRYTIDNNAPEFITANLARNQLIASLGSANHSFTLNVPTLPAGVHVITFWAVDPASGFLVSLGSHQIVAGNPARNPLPRGALEVVSATRISGWANDPSSPAASILLRIDVDGARGMPFVANLNRPDLLRRIGSTRHGFSRALKLSPGAHKIAVYAIDTTTFTAVLLKSQIVNDAAPRGSFDALTPTAALGWAFLPALAGKPVTVRLDIDDVPGITATANASRPDLTPTLGGPNFGFNIPLPHLLPGQHTARIYLIDPLTLTPTLIGSKTFTI